MFKRWAALARASRSGPRISACDVQVVAWLATGAAKTPQIKPHEIRAVAQCFESRIDILSAPPHGAMFNKSKACCERLRATASLVHVETLVPAGRRAGDGQHMMQRKPNANNSVRRQLRRLAASAATLALATAVWAQAPLNPAAPKAHRPHKPHAAQPAQVQQPLVDATPPQPEMPKWPANEAPSQPTVTWNSQGLSIQASNSSLSQILNAIGTKTGAKIEGVSGDERVFGEYGPGPARDVLTQLLRGSAYDFLMLGDQGQGTPRQVILTARRGGAATPSRNVSPQQPQDPTDDEGVSEPEPEEQIQPPPAPQQQQPQAMPQQEPMTPQQRMQMMQQQRLQQMQQLQQQYQQQQQQQPQPQ
jgi:hypothetical protein